MRSAVILRSKAAAKNGQQPQQKGDEKANTDTHCMQFSAIGSVRRSDVSRFIDTSLQKRFLIVTFGWRVPSYGVGKLHQSHVAVPGDILGTKMRGGLPIPASVGTMGDRVFPF
jgi:hypothetical protein